MEELAAAEEAKKVVDTLSVTTSPADPTMLETFRNGYDQVRRALPPAFSSDEALDALRNDVILALINVLGSLQARTLTQKKIDKAKDLVEAWIRLLKGQEG